MKKQLVLLGIDFGMKKIGLAIGQTLTNTASPIDPIPARDGIPNWDHLQKVIETWRIDACVVGMPLNKDGSFQETTHAAKKFALRLGQKFGKPVHLMDERFTTVEARSYLRHASESVDSWAAKLILESWLREQENGKKTTDNT